MCPDMVAMQERCLLEFHDSRMKKQRNDKPKTNDKNEKKDEPREFASSFAQLAESAAKKVCWVCGGNHYANE